MNDIVRNTGAANAVAALGQLRQGLANVKQTLVVKGGDPYLRMLKDGIWVYGQEDAEVGKGSLWAVNPMSLQHGFIAWADGDGDNSGGPLGEVMVPATSPLPDRNQLRDVGADWDQQFSFQLKCVEGEDAGTQVLYKTASTGGTNAVDKLIAKIMTQLDADPEHPVPVIELSNDSYPHKKWGKTYVPVFIVRDWANMAMDDLVGGQPEPEPELPLATPEPAPRKRRTKAEMEAAKAEADKAAANSYTAAHRIDDDDNVAEKGDDDLPSMEELEAMIAARQAKASQPKEDPAAARRRELEAQLAELNGGGSSPAATDPGQPIRRRRQ